MPDFRGLYDFFVFADIFADFVESSFDARYYASVIIEGEMIGESLAKLNEGITLLDKELLSQVGILSQIKSISYLIWTKFGSHIYLDSRYAE